MKNKLNIFKNIKSQQTYSVGFLYCRAKYKGWVDKSSFAALCILINSVHFITAQNVSTIGGTGYQGFSGDGGNAIDSKINKPLGITTDFLGNIYFADTHNHRIRKINQNGIITTIAGNGIMGFSGDSGLAVNAALNYPNSVSLDSQGNIYIADTGNNRIRKVNSSGVINTIAGTGACGNIGDGGQATSAAICTPVKAVVDNFGYIYVAGGGMGDIRKISPNGIISTIAGVPGYCDYNGDGIPASQSYLCLPGDICIDKYGNIYISDMLEFRIRKINSTGVITTVAGNGNAGHDVDGILAINSSLDHPSGISIDKNGILYICEQPSGYIRKVSNGVITTIAGTGISGYNGDGNLLINTQFNFPYGIVVDSSNSIFVADHLNNRIRKLASTVLSVDENRDSKINSILYPNPNKGEFKILIKEVSNESNIQLFVFDTSGKQVIKDQKTIINNIVHCNYDLLNGIYLLKLTFKDGTFYTHNFIINKSQN